MRNELIDLYKLACANWQDKDIVRAYQRAKDRIGPQIAIHEALDNDDFRARFANWQDDMNAVLKQRDDLHARVSRLEGVVRMLISCVEDASILAFDDELESARRALEDECPE